MRMHVQWGRLLTFDDEPFCFVFQDNRRPHPRNGMTLRPCNHTPSQPRNMALNITLVTSLSFHCFLRRCLPSLMKSIHQRRAQSALEQASEIFKTTISALEGKERLVKHPERSDSCCTSGPKFWSAVAPL